MVAGSPATPTEAAKAISRAAKSKSSAICNVSSQTLNGRQVNWEGPSLSNSYRWKNTTLSIKQIFKSKRGSRSPTPWCYKAGQKALSKSVQILCQQQNNNVRRRSHAQHSAGFSNTLGKSHTNLCVASYF